MKPIHFKNSIIRKKLIKILNYSISQKEDYNKIQKYQRKIPKIDMYFIFINSS